jgi:hypothetical protein
MKLFIFYSLGSDHDGEGKNDCNPRGPYLMATGGNNPLSPCSIQQIKNVILTNSTG